MTAQNDKPLRPRPQLLQDIEALAKLLDESQKWYPHRYKYGYGYRIQNLVADMIECYHFSQIHTDFNRRADVLQRLLIKLDSIYSLLEIIASIGGFPDDKLNQIYRLMDGIAKQTKGLKAYFATKSNSAGKYPPPQNKAL